MLLHSLLPEATIDRLKQEADWQDAKETQSVLSVVELGARGGLTESLHFSCGMRENPKRSARSFLRAETPAQQMLTVLKAFIEGKAPPMALVLSAQRALQQSVDVYRPPNKELQARLKQADMDVSSRDGVLRREAWVVLAPHDQRVPCSWSCRRRRATPWPSSWAKPIPWGGP